jgi:hypothetical protein
MLLNCKQALEERRHNENAEQMNGLKELLGYTIQIKLD